MLCFIGFETRENIEELQQIRVAITKAKETIDIQNANVTVAGRVKLEVILYEQYWQGFQKYKAKTKKSIAVEKFNTVPDMPQKPI